MVANRLLGGDFVCGEMTVNYIHGCRALPITPGPGCSKLGHPGLVRTLNSHIRA